MERPRCDADNLGLGVQTIMSQPNATSPRKWRQGLPTLAGATVTLRELRPSDAASLVAALATSEVSRFISPPPTAVDGFERFIAWAHRERAAGTCVCFAVVPRGIEQPIGVFQVRQLDSTFETAEWGFAIAPAFWGTGVFVDAATLVINFAFDEIGAHRLEARAALPNGRGNGALRKIGARQEGILRKSLFRSGEHFDQALWALLDDDWRRMPRNWVH
jgi:RimJ/RimL family protein N-acetyltransferase